MKLVESTNEKEIQFALLYSIRPPVRLLSFNELDHAERHVNSHVLKVRSESVN